MVLLVPIKSEQRIKVNRTIKLQLTLPSVGSPDVDLAQNIPAEHWKGVASTRQLLHAGELDVSVYVNHQLEGEAKKCKAAVTQRLGRAELSSTRSWFETAPGNRLPFCLGYDAEGPHFPGMPPRPGAWHDHSGFQIALSHENETADLSGGLLYSVHFRFTCRDPLFPRELAELWHAFQETDPETGLPQWRSFARRIEAVAPGGAPPQWPVAQLTLAPEGLHEAVSLPVPWVRFAADQPRELYLAVRGLPTKPGASRPAWLGADPLRGRARLDALAARCGFTFQRMDESGVHYAWNVSKGAQEKFVIDLIATASIHLHQMDNGRSRAIVERWELGPVCLCDRVDCPINRSLQQGN